MVLKLAGVKNMKILYTCKTDNSGFSFIIVYAKHAMIIGVVQFRAYRLYSIKLSELGNFDMDN